jgi:predicted Zn-dependent protease
VRNIRPLNVVFQEGVTASQENSILIALHQMMELANVERYMLVNNFGVWRQPGYRREDRTFRPYMSIDWYTQRGHELSTRPNQVNANQVIGLLNSEPWQEYQPHYDLMVICDDMYSEGCNFVVGLAQPNLGTIISTHRFLGVGSGLQERCLQTVVYHEVGHVFGLPDNRSRNITESLGRHCTNECVMRQGLRVPHDWITFTQDRLRSNQPYCAECLQGLNQWFQ